MINMMKMVELRGSGREGGLFGESKKGVVNHCLLSVPLTDTSLFIETQTHIP